MEIEVRAGAQMRADCISDTHAIEIDFAQKWKQGIGQALAYGVATGLRSGLVLICELNDVLAWWFRWVHNKPMVPLASA